MLDSSFDDNLTERIIYCIIRVHQTLGPGFREIIYKRALLIELARQNLRVETEREILMYYDGCKVGRHMLDIVVEGRVIVELKAVDNLGKTQYAQIRSYLNASGIKLGILVNFSGERADYRRVIGR